MALAEVVLDDRHNVKELILAVGLYLLDNTRQIGVQHEAVLNDRRFGQGGVDLTALEPVTDLDGHGDSPQPVGVERGNRRASADERARLLLDRLQGTLDAVEDVVEYARSQKYVHRCARACDGVARLEACCFLIDLNRGELVGDTDHLAHEVLRTDVHHFHHLKAIGVFDGDNRAVDSVYYIIIHIHSSLSVHRRVQSTERAAFSTNQPRCSSSLLSRVSSAIMPISAQ